MSDACLGVDSFLVSLVRRPPDDSKDIEHAPGQPKQLIFHHITETALRPYLEKRISCEFRELPNYRRHSYKPNNHHCSANAGLRRCKMDIREKVYDTIEGVGNGDTAERMHYHVQPI